MAYDEHLAARIRALLADEPGLTEQRMFGSQAFLVGGNLAAGANTEGMLLRVDPAESEALLDPPSVERFEMRGRPMAGWLHVAQEAVADEECLRRWVLVGVGYARSLPPKDPATARA